MAAVGSKGSELRRKQRRLFNHAARIVTGKDAPPVPCHLADVSDSGARLSIEAGVELPDTFVLLLTENGVPRRYCRVAWRTGSMIGVKFLAGLS
jgi:hypothetical protein